VIQINLYRTRTEGWRAEVVITEPEIPYRVPFTHRYETEEVRALSKSAASDALARRSVLELANQRIAEHFCWPWITSRTEPTI
jgi:hypothetical protein